MSRVLARRDPRRTWMRVAMAAGAAAAVGFGAWSLRRFDPNAADSPFLPCLFQAFTGLYCPGCGTTRALHALVHGDVATAIAMNPLLFVLVPLLGVVLLHASGRPVPLPRRAVNTLLGPWFWLALIGGYWLLRNVPVWPFTMLVPA